MESVCSLARLRYKYGEGVRAYWDVSVAVFRSDFSANLKAAEGFHYA